MENLINSITNFIVDLPPMLQMLAGLFGTLAILRIFMFIVDFIEDRREGH
ncbi:MAG: hypothetical protein HOI59_12415 [Nitrospina sp.]|jgi:hypothetical protein|nr:hypothetical protein [Nitrospina sp.]MBT3415318.1 hypothetical protein [Nitrospina sp.]MBT3855776.1 hypothetical protein [Nitrospina sp.]MBT4105214.1 hypothetical protein [Nitrospina sp.]MBT4390146.1 hypothetical protein [Nitrospina sp.]